ncbi:MAG: SMI1/KNR4 family protein [Actinomycetaceae bacterium]
MSHDEPCSRFNDTTPDTIIRVVEELLLLPWATGADAPVERTVEGVAVTSSEDADVHELEVARTRTFADDAGERLDGAKNRAAPVAGQIVDAARAAWGEPGVLREADDPTACTLFEVMMSLWGLDSVLAWQRDERYILFIDGIEQDLDDCATVFWVVSRSVVEDVAYSIAPGKDARRIASSGTYEEFVEVYDPSMATATGTHNLLLGCMLHRDPGTRLRIASRLLDDGADANAVTGSGVSALHIVLSDHGNRTRDYVLDAQLLQRLLDAGADVNRSQNRHGTPLALMYAEGLMSNGHAGAQAEPLWDVLFSRPDLNFDVPISTDGSNLTLRDRILDTEHRGWNVAMFRERLRAYDAGTERHRTLGVDEAWDIIERVLGEVCPDVAATLRGPASEADLVRLARTVGRDLPADLLQSLRRHDGQDNPTQLLDLFDHHTLLSVDAMIEQSDTLADVLGDDVEDVIDWMTPEKVRPIANCRGWLQFTAAEGQGYALDLDPLPAGEAGQVIYLPVDGPTPTPEFGSYRTWLSSYAEKLASGSFTLGEDGDLWLDD